MAEERTEDLRDRLRSFVSYHVGEAIQHQLEIRAKSYKAKHSDADRVRFVAEYLPKFNREHPQNTNRPYVFCMFTVATQHQWADSIEELLDRGIDIVKSKT